MKDSVTQSPEFLSKTLKAQQSLGRSMRAGDSEHLAATFEIQDMLDMLGKEIDKGKK